MANGYFGGGDGSESNPFLVEDAADLRAIDSLYQFGNIPYYYFKQTNNIIISEDWEPLLSAEDIEYTIIDDSRYFRGEFDGAGYFISGLSISRYVEVKISGYPIGGSHYLKSSGLFAKTGDCIFKNVHLINVSIDITRSEDTPVIAIGGFIGSGSAIFDRCSFQGTIRVTGAFTGYLHSSSSSTLVGGFLGYAGSGSFKESYCKADIICMLDEQMETDYLDIGGFIGNTEYFGFIRSEDSYSECDISILSVSRSMDRISVGGLSRTSLGSRDTVKNSYSASTIAIAVGARNVFTGGIALEGDEPVNSYYDSTLFGVEGVGIPKPTELMKRKSTFINWNFNSIWKIDENKDYPRLRWEVPSLFCKSTPFPLNFRKMTVT